jgi:hypothetical protein
MILTNDTDFNRCALKQTCFAVVGGATGHRNCWLIMKLGATASHGCKAKSKVFLCILCMLNLTLESLFLLKKAASKYVG